MYVCIYKYMYRPAGASWAGSQQRDVTHARRVRVICAMGQDAAPKDHTRTCNMCSLTTCTPIQIFVVVNNLHAC